MSDSKYRVLVVGVGSIGERHVRCFLATGRAAIGVCESMTARGKDVADRYGLDACFAKLNDALTQPWDAAVVAAPAHVHIPIATELAQHRIHLFIEKPLATSLDGVEALREVIAKNCLTAAVGYHYRAHPAVREMKVALDSGQFGRPLQVYGMVAQYFPFYRPAYREVYFARHEHGGGAVQDAITHLLNLGEYFVGPITRLAVDAAHQALDGVTVEDTVHVLARHGDVLGNYALNLYQHPNESHLTVVCAGGTLRFELQQNRWWSMTEPEGPRDEHLHELKDRDAWYVANANAFLDALEGKAAPLCSLDEGIQTLRVNLAALTSTETQTWQDIAAPALGCAPKRVKN